MPIVFVLYDMEKEGISIDGQALKEYGEKLSVSIAQLESKIYEAADFGLGYNVEKYIGVKFIKVTKNYVIYKKYIFNGGVLNIS